MTMPKSKILKLSFGVIIITIFFISYVSSQFRFYTQYANSNYNNSQNLLYNGSIVSDFACLLKCKTYSGCIIAVLTTNVDNTISCRFYRGFYGIYDLQTWLTYDSTSRLYYRGMGINKDTLDKKIL